MFMQIKTNIQRSEIFINIKKRILHKDSNLYIKLLNK